MVVFFSIYDTNLDLGGIQFGGTFLRPLQVFTGSPHFTRFHFARSSLYTRLMFLPNEFTLFNALHDFLTLPCQNNHLSRYILCIIPQTRTLGGSSIWIGAKFALGKWLGRYVAIHTKFGLQTCWRLQLFWILGFECTLKYLGSKGIKKI